MTTLRIGMPAGSLADPKRGGNLIELLERSGFATTGYDQGGPTRFASAGFLYGWDGRPQEFGSQLAIHELDVAIAGDDWIRERVLEMEYEYGRTIVLERVLSLKRGGVRIVGIIDADSGHKTAEDLLRIRCGEKPLITAVAEMPYLALHWLRGKLAAIGCLERFQRFSVQKYKTPPRIEAGVVIYETWGKTEAKVKNGGADLGVEITQSGSAIKNYGLTMVDTVMASESSVWIDPALRQDPEKTELLRMFLLNLAGTVNAENKVMIIFNVENQRAGQAEAFLRQNRLFGDEPTISPGPAFTEFSIQVDTADPRTPLARVRYDLARMGARSIDTLPIISSITGIEAAGL